MFNIGGGEFLVIALIALIVLGPQRLPDAARQAGKAMGELRRLSSGFQNELKDAFTESDSGTPTTARRNVLASSVEPSASLSTAVSAVSSQPRARRTPLKAASPEGEVATFGGARPSGTSAKNGTKKAAASTKVAAAKKKAPGATKSPAAKTAAAKTAAAKTAAAKTAAAKSSAAKTSAKASSVPTARRPRTKNS